MSTVKVKNVRAGETILLAGGPHRVVRSSKRGDHQVLVLSTATGLATWELSREQSVERLGFSAATNARMAKS